MARGQRFTASRRLVRIGLATSLLTMGTGLSAAPTFAAAPAPTVQFRLPFAGGQMWNVAQGWDNCAKSHCSDDPLNRYAYDFKPPATHLPVVAAADGTVTLAKYDPNAPCKTTEAGYGLENKVRIQHADTTYSVYVHLTDVFVTGSQKVKQGQIIGTSGCTGYTYSNGNAFEHLHFSRQWLNGSSYVAMKTSFMDEKSSGELTNYPADADELLEGKWYLSYNPCSQALAAPSTDDYAIPTGKFCARYYLDRTLGVLDAATKPTLDGSTYTSKQKRASVMSRTETSIYHPDWATTGFPEASYAGQSYKPYDDYWTTSEFGARYVGRFNFYADTWTFFVTASDGIKVTIDGVVMRNVWSDRSTNYVTQFDKQMTSGYHTIEVNYYNSGSAPKLSFTWADCDTGVCS